MNDHIEKLKRIREQASKLLTDYQQLKTQYEHLFSENQNLKKVVENHENMIRQLEETNKMSKLADVIHQSELDVQDIREKISRQISAIDECIRLLSD